MKKYKFFSDFQKEEKWLEIMAAQGWHLKEYNNIYYTFEPTPPQQANIRIDFRDFNSQQDFQDYRSLFEDSGWRHLAGTKNSGNQYFIRMDGDCSEDIFSDSASRVGRYKRQANMWLTLALVFLPFPIILEWYFVAIPLAFFICALYAWCEYKKAMKRDDNQ